MNPALNVLLLRLESLHEAQDSALALPGDLSDCHWLHTPLHHETCARLTGLASVFGCEPAVLATAVLKAALADLVGGLEHDMDAWADCACESLLDPARIASEAI